MKLQDLLHERVVYTAGEFPKEEGEQGQIYSITARQGISEVGIIYSDGSIEFYQDIDNMFLVDYGMMTIKEALKPRLRIVQ